MCDGLDKELNRGKVLATIFAEHLDDMGGAECEIPVEARGKKYVCRCETEKPASVVCPDVDGGYLVGGVKFKEQRFADEYVNARNDNKIIRTLIAFHTDECCGCAHFYFSPRKQKMIAICNECGLRREIGLDDAVSGSIIDSTQPFEES